MKKLIYITFAVVLFSSCEKIIELDLNSTNPVVVIEASINDEPGPYEVRVQSTVNYDAAGEGWINNALCIMSDDAGNIDTLISAGAGKYFTQTIQGLVGRNYTLRVQADGVEYVHSSFLNERVEIDTAIAEFTVSPFSQEEVVRVTSLFMEPATADDYYRMLFLVRGKPYIAGYSDFDLIDDVVSTDPVPLFRGFQSDTLYAGDTVDVELRHIDKKAYDYFTTLSELASGGFAPQGIPENPLTSWSNGATGYFSAFAVGKKQVIITE
jgi:hypothetical protein